MHGSKRIILATLMAAALTGTALSQQNQDIPKDLRPLLAPRRSEMRLVATRYSADRNLLTTNFAGTAIGGGRGGRAPHAAVGPVRARA
jgi:hypothetical protein